LLALLAALPLVAWAADYKYTARTAAPVKAKGVVTAAGIQWNCTGSQCTATGPWAAPGVAACGALARQVGRIVAYGHPGKQLAAAELTSCNGSTAQLQPAVVAAKPAPSVAQAVQKPTSPGTQAKPAEAKPAAAPATARGGPATFATASLTVTGTGALAPRGPFTPKSFSTEGLTVTGSGALAPRGPFTPKTFSTEGLRITGTGTLQ
jgi:hypothetical protein